MHREKRNSSGPAPGWSPKLRCRHRIQSNETGRTRCSAQTYSTQSMAFRAHWKWTYSPPGSWLNCPPLWVGDQTQRQWQQILSPHPGQDWGLCKLAMEPGGEGRVLAQAWQQKADLVLVAPVWKKQTWYPTVLEIFPTVDYSQEGPNSTNTLTRNARCGPPTSCVEYLWRRYQVQQLSEKATELMLMSWREKSSKAYDSQFQKWIGWYNSRGADPFLAL